jgi:hypothetical protein
VRTTVTIDEDVARLLSKETKRAGLSFKQAVNHYLRLGLMAEKQPVAKPFKITPRALGLPPGLSYDNVEDLIEVLEGPYHK